MIFVWFVKLLKYILSKLDKYINKWYNKEYIIGKYSFYGFDTKRYKYGDVSIWLTDIR